MPSLLDQYERRGFRLVKNLATLGAALSESRPVDADLSEQITCLQAILPGEVPEWLIGPVSKAFKTIFRLPAKSRGNTLILGISALPRRWPLRRRARARSRLLRP